MQDVVPFSHIGWNRSCQREYIMMAAICSAMSSASVKVESAASCHAFVKNPQMKKGIH